jgi:uncharacterized protein (UPF0332 family)
MTLTSDERKAILALRIEKAQSTLKEAEGIARLGYWNAVANRLYYACYYISGALLIKHGFQAQTHKGIITLLGMHFIRGKLISPESGRLISRLFELRQTGDYDDLFSLTEEDVKPLISSAQAYIDELKKLIDNDLSNPVFGISIPDQEK